MTTRAFSCLLLVGLCTLVGCANISSPTGGKKDIIPPKLLSVSPSDSLLNTRASKILLYFDEYLTVGEVQKEVQIQPLLSIAPTVSGINKHVVVKLIDSLLEDNTTYRITFGNAIRDLHEGNPFSGYSYTFSTGGYFDSLQLKGMLLNSATGQPDTSSIVLLYAGDEGDSAIVKKKPKYVVKPDSKGVFLFEGLPGRSFRMYAVRDDNNNMIYDGGAEMVAFSDSLVFPVDSIGVLHTLRVFMEVPDSTAVSDSLKPAKRGLKGRKEKPVIIDSNLIWSVNIDTTSIVRRSFDITDSIKMVFNREPEIDISKMRLSFDSNEVVVNLPIRVHADSVKANTIYVAARFKENTVYSLAVDSAFGIDTGGVYTAAATYRFRTFNDKDYGKITLNVPSKYVNDKREGEGDGPDYLLLLKADGDTLYQKKLTDSVIFFGRLKPAKYTFRIIVDENRDGVWTTGKLLEFVQPEVVIPGDEPLMLKAGWEHTVDFERKPKSLKNREKGKSKL